MVFRSLDLSTPILDLHSSNASSTPSWQRLYRLSWQHVPGHMVDSHVSTQFGHAGACVLCLSLPSPPSLPLDPPVWRNVPTRVETGPGARDATYWKHPGVSPIIHVTVGWAELVSPGLPRWQHTGSSGHCWFPSQLWFFSISNVDSDILFSKWGKGAASQRMGLSHALDTNACRRHLPVTSLHSHVQP